MGFYAGTRKFGIIGIMAAALSCACAVAQAQATAGTPVGVSLVQTVEGITEYRLTNGLKVLLAPDAADERVSVNLTYMVGSRHEGYGEAGMAHLLEHLIFKGTPATPDPKTEFRKRGFTFNGTTAHDRTNYFATFVSSQESLDWYLGWQADAMIHSFIAKKDLDSEMSVVRNEYEIKENNPLQALVQRMNSVAYLWHNYRKAPIGEKSDIENIDIANLQIFYRRYYRPDNAVLIVAGKFDAAQTLLTIQKTLGGIERPGTPIPKTHTQEPVQDGERSVTVRRPAAVQVIAAAYHVPPALHPDTAPLTILALVLGDAPAGRLYKALVQTKLAQVAIALPALQRETGSFVTVAVLGPDDDAAERQKILLDVVENLGRNPVTAEEFERARNKANKTLELAFANAAAVANGAIAMEAMGDWRAVFVGRERMKNVTLDDVNRVARAYFLRDNRTLGQLIPTKQPVRAPEPQTPDVEAYLRGFTLKAEGLESIAFDFSPKSLGEKVAFAQTPGGIKTGILDKPVRGDLVTMHLRLKFGTQESLRDRLAAAALVGPLLLRGTSHMSRQQIDDQLVKLGARLIVSFNEAGGNVSLVAKKENFKPALDLAVHLLKDASFPEADFEEIRGASIKGIEGQILDKSSQAENAWGRYGNPYQKGDPRYRYTLEDWLREMKSVSLAQVREFHGRFYGAQDAQFSLLGPVDAEEYSRLVREALDGWHAKEEWRRIEHPLVQPEPRRMVFDTPDKTNVSLRGYQRIPVSTEGMEPEYFSLSLAARILGGGPGSRLWVRLRESGGLSYNAGAHLTASAYERAGSIGLNAEVAPQNLSAAEKALHEELQRSLKEGFTQSELESFKRQTLADCVRQRSGDAWAMSFMSGQMEFAYPIDVREKHDALIQSLTLADVNAAWRKYLDPEKMVWGVFGDQSKVK